MAYLTKQQVVADFKLNYIPLIKDAPLSIKEQAWDLLLGSLYDDHKISQSQKNTWKFPKKELSL